MSAAQRDHGGGLDAARLAYGGQRGDWLDLSTGINPLPYPVETLPPNIWTALPDQSAMDRLLAAARGFWNVPKGAQVVAANGASALIARMPDLTKATHVTIPGPTYNEHEAAFRSAGIQINTPTAGAVEAQVFVHPNNPDGRLYDAASLTQGHHDLTLIDESFCDEMPDASHIGLTQIPRHVVLKSFGKFWGLAGLRLGFAIATPDSLMRPARDGSPITSLSDMLGPWSVSGPALHIGARALEDLDWATTTRTRLAKDAATLDALMTAQGAAIVGGTTLFRLYAVADAADWQDRLARHHVWSRVFPYNPRWLRLGLPAPDRWDQLKRALA